MPLGPQKLQMLIFYCVRFIYLFVVQRDLFDFVDFIVFSEVCEAICNSTQND